jgi:GNAT superfamily N-acetyltransferase
LLKFTNDYIILLIMTREVSHDPEEQGLHFFREDPDISADMRAELLKQVSETTIQVPGLVPLSVTELVQGSTGFWWATTEINGEQKLVGFLRERYPREVQLADTTIQAQELGTLLVDPAFQGQKVAQRLIRYAAAHAEADGAVPLAVCQGAGQQVFENQGFQRVGILEREDGDYRFVEARLPDQTNQETQIMLAESLTRLDRFAGMSVLEHVEYAA